MPTIDLRNAPAFARLGDDWVAAITAAPLPGLGDGPHDPVLAEMLSRQQPFATPRLAHADATCRAGLWLLAGDLEASHRISQSDDSPEGSFWHGIMHRRERDYSNAKYWFRRVGVHPVLIALQSHLGTAYGDFDTFTDRCEQAFRRPADLKELEIVQFSEWETLMKFCISPD